MAEKRLIDGKFLLFKNYIKAEPDLRESGFIFVLLHYAFIFLSDIFVYALKWCLLVAIKAVQRVKYFGRPLFHIWYKKFQLCLLLFALICDRNVRVVTTFSAENGFI